MGFKIGEYVVFKNDKEKNDYRTIGFDWYDMFIVDEICNRYPEEMYYLRHLENGKKIRMIFLKSSTPYECSLHYRHQLQLVKPSELAKLRIKNAI